MFHKSQLGSFGDRLPADLNGYVPEHGDDPGDFSWPHDEFEDDYDDAGNGYDGYAHERWSEFVDDAVKATDEASEALDEWRRRDN